MLRLAAVLLVSMSTACSSAGESCAGSGDCYPWLACKGNVCVNEGDEKHGDAARGINDAESAARRYREKHGDCPRASDLVNEKLLAKDKDPWGLPYEIICGDIETVIVRSNGSDAEPGTDDDVYADFDPPDRLARRMVKALAHQAAYGKRWHTCPTTTDPWGTTTSGTCDVSGATIVSAGPDRELGTDDDVTARVDAPD